MRNLAGQDDETSGVLQVTPRQNQRNIETVIIIHAEDALVVTSTFGHGPLAASQAG